MSFKSGDVLRNRGSTEMARELPSRYSDPTLAYGDAARDAKIGPVMIPHKSCSAVRSDRLAMIERQTSVFEPTKES
jgi:hypothetical protein